MKSFEYFRATQVLLQQNSKSELLKTKITQKRKSLT